MRFFPTLAAAILSATLGFAAPAIGDDAPVEKIKVVASFSIIGDLVRQVGGDRVDVSTLVGPDGDAHVYQPTPADAKKVAEAKLVVINGVGLEGWFERFIKASGANPPITIAAASAKLYSPGKSGEAPGHSHGDFDPHAWQDISNAKTYVSEIEKGLEGVDPAGKDVYQANAKAYREKLDALEIEVRNGVASIPVKNRRIITTHDAFGYFGRAYGMTFIAPQGMSTDTEASAKDVAKIIRQIRAEHIPAVFLENVSDPRLIQQIARESGAKIGGALFSDALSPAGGPAATYIDMMHNNLAQFIAALGQSHSAL